MCHGCLCRFPVPVRRVWAALHDHSWGAVCSDGAPCRGKAETQSLLPSSSILVQHCARGLPSSSSGLILLSQGHVYLAAIQSEETSHCREDWRFFHLRFKIRVLTRIPLPENPPRAVPDHSPRQAAPGHWFTPVTWRCGEQEAVVPLRG